MRKNVFLAFFALLSVVLLTGCVGGGGSTAGDTVSSSFLGLDITCRAGWDCAADDYGMVTIQKGDSTMELTQVVSASVDQAYTNEKTSWTGSGFNEIDEEGEVDGAKYFTSHHTQYSNKALTMVKQVGSHSIICKGFASNDEFDALKDDFIATCSSMVPLAE